MLLTLDIGNTEITVGLFLRNDVTAHWRLTTNPDRTPDEWASAIEAFLLHAGHSPNEVRACCFASVAPPAVSVAWSAASVCSRSDDVVRTMCAGCACSAVHPGQIRSNSSTSVRSHAQCRLEASSGNADNASGMAGRTSNRRTGRIGGRG